MSAQTTDALAEIRIISTYEGGPYSRLTTSKLLCFSPAFTFSQHFQPVSLERKKLVTGSHAPRSVSPALDAHTVEWGLVGTRKGMPSESITRVHYGRFHFVQDAPLIRP